LTWGGDKRAAAEVELPMRGGPLSRVKGALAVSRREHPSFDEDVTRRGATVRVERDVTRRVRFGASTGVERVSFLDGAERNNAFGVDALVDTRIDPFLPGDAVYGRASWTRLQFQRSPDASRRELDARGYLGLPHAGILEVRGLHQGSTAPLPPVFKPMLGGASSLRGFSTGAFIADNVTAASAELRVPLNSVLSRGKMGVSAFFDVGAAYDHGNSVHDQKFQRGAGGGVWLAIAVFKADLYVAHGLGADTRVHFNLSTTF
jgi:outer membrane protein assembly factor BamA